jgi:hypothetical protein
MPRNEVQPGASGESVVSAAEANIEALITGLRPQASDTEPASKMAIATDAVTDEMARLLAAADPKLPGKQRQQRLHAIHQSERRKASREQREIGAPESRRTA